MDQDRISRRRRFGDGQLRPSAPKRKLVGKMGGAVAPEKGKERGREGKRKGREEWEEGGKEKKEREKEEKERGRRHFQWFVGQNWLKMSLQRCRQLSLTQKRGECPCKRRTKAEESEANRRTNDRKWILLIREFM